MAPHQDNTKKWAVCNGHKGSFTELCNLDELKQYILQELKAVAEKNKVQLDLWSSRSFRNVFLRIYDDTLIDKLVLLPGLDNS